MSLVSKLADLAVAGGGQIARAVQISNREEEQAEAQAEYDRKLQSEIESRQRSAQAEIAEAELGGGPQAFMSDFFFSRPDVALKPSDAPDTSAFRGVTQSRSAPIVASGRMAPEDVRRFAAGQAPRTPVEISGFDVSSGRYMPPEEMPGLIEPPSTPSSQVTRDDVIREARAANIDTSAPFVREALARAAQASDIPRPGELDELDLQDLLLRRQAVEQRRAQALQQAQQAMQGRDFRQEAIEAIGPAPEAKLFRIADILAAAPSARTAEQRAMLLQAAADSPDIQAANLSDWAKGAYRDRAMKTVMGLFPKEEEPMSELDMLRIQSMRERMETENLRQQKLQAALDKEAADLVRQAERLKGGNARAKKMGALVDQSVFFLQNYKARSEGDMDDATWSAGAGQFAGDRPESIVAHAQRLKLPRRSIAAIRGGAPMLLRRAPTDPPPPRVLMSQGERRLRQNSIVKHDKDEAEASGNVRQLQGYLTKTPRELKALNLTREGIESKIEEQEKLADIAKSAAKSNRDALKADREAREQGTTSVPSGAVYNAPPEGETEQEKYNRLNARLK